MVELDFDLFSYFSFNIYSGERHVFMKLFLTFLAYFLRILRCLKTLKITFGRGLRPPPPPPTHTLGALPQDPAGDLRPPDPRLFRIGFLALLSLVGWLFWV